MASLWILNKDLSPIEASKQGKDASVCGDCKHRTNKGGACYVVLFQAPQSIYNAYKRGSYPKLPADLELTNKKIRFGAYGDPSALPMETLKDLRLRSFDKKATSYTHQWKQVSKNGLKDFSMASVDNVEEYQQAKQLGFRTFRVINAGDPLMKNEIMCPNTTHGIECRDCGLCNGLSSPKSKDIVIEVHGSRKGKFNK